MHKNSSQHNPKTTVNLSPLNSSIKAEIAPFHFDYKILKNLDLRKWLMNHTILIRAKFYSESLDKLYLIQALNEAQQKLDYTTYLNWLNTELIEPGYVSQSFIQ